MLKDITSKLLTDLARFCRPIMTRRANSANRFLRDEKGATAVEFAMVATPFLAVLFAIFETAIVFLASQTLETAVADSARLIMTGQAQGPQPDGSSQMDATSFKKALCGRIYAMFDCLNSMYIDVQTYSSFGGIDNSVPLDSGGNFPTKNVPFNMGAAGDIVVVRAMYQWQVYADPLIYLSNVAGSASHKRLLRASAAFRNEPYN